MVRDDSLRGRDQQSQVPEHLVVAPCEAEPPELPGRHAAKFRERRRESVRAHARVEDEADVPVESLAAPLERTGVCEDPPELEFVNRGPQLLRRDPPGRVRRVLPEMEMPSWEDPSVGLEWGDRIDGV